MLLSLMRQHAKSWLIKFLIAIIALVFIFYFGYSFRSGNVVKIAYVNGELITGLEFQKTYQDMLTAVRAQYKDMLNDNLLKAMDLKNRALDTLITHKLISQEARRIGLEVTEKEVQDAIMQYPAFQINGRFDLRRYQALLANNRMNPEDFEEDMAGNLLQEKIRQFLFVFMGATDQEVMDHFKFATEKVNMEFVRFQSANYGQGIRLTPEDLKAFFTEHKEEYRIPEKIKAVYVEIDPQSFKARVKITDDDVKAYYEYNLASYQHPKEVSVRHILFKLDPKAAEEQEREVRTKAMGVLEQARKGKDFAELARTYSESPDKDRGGDLGFFPQGRMMKPFDEAAFKLGKGEVSDPVRTDFGYHLIKVEDVKEAGTDPLEKVHGDIVAKMTDDAAMELAHEKGLSLLDQLPYDGSLEAFAKEQGFGSKFTDYVTQQDTLPGISGDPRFMESLFGLEPKQTSELMELGGKFYIFQVLDRKPAYLPEMDEVADKVRADLTESRKKEAAKAAAAEFLSKVREGKDWGTLAKEQNLKIEESGFFLRQGSAGKIGGIPDLNEAAFRLNVRNKYPEKVFENQDGAVVIRWAGVEDADEKQLRESKDAYRYSLVVEKQRRAFQSWLEQLRKDAQIEIVTPVS
jgi:peptidyl-prolyl cis-trans isomerase D